MLSHVSAAGRGLAVLPAPHGPAAPCKSLGHTPLRRTAATAPPPLGIVEDHTLDDIFSLLPGPTSGKRAGAAGSDEPEGQLTSAGSEAASPPAAQRRRAAAGRGARRPRLTPGGSSTSADGGSSTSGSPDPWQQGGQHPSPSALPPHPTASTGIGAVRVQGVDQQDPPAAQAGSAGTLWAPGASRVGADVESQEEAGRGAGSDQGMASPGGSSRPGGRVAALVARAAARHAKGQGSGEAAGGQAPPTTGTMLKQPAAAAAAAAAAAQPAAATVPPTPQGVQPAAALTRSLWPREQPAAAAAALHQATAATKPLVPEQATAPLPSVPKQATPAAPQGSEQAAAGGFQGFAPPQPGIGPAPLLQTALRRRSRLQTLSTTVPVPSLLQRSEHGTWQQAGQGQVWGSAYTPAGQGPPLQSRRGAAGRAGGGGTPPLAHQGEQRQAGQGQVGRSLVAPGDQGWGAGSSSATPALSQPLAAASGRGRRRQAGRAVDGQAAGMAAGIVGGAAAAAAAGSQGTGSGRQVQGGLPDPGPGTPGGRVVVEAVGTVASRGSSRRRRGDSSSSSPQPPPPTATQAAHNSSSSSRRGDPLSSSHRSAASPYSSSFPGPAPSSSGSDPPAPSQLPSSSSSSRPSARRALQSRRPLTLRAGQEALLAQYIHQQQLQGLDQQDLDQRDPAQGDEDEQEPTSRNQPHLMQSSVTSHSWRKVAALTLPEVYQYENHTCLFEFMYDLWPAVGKALRLRAPSLPGASASRLVAAAFALLSSCWRSPEPAMRQGAVLALADCLADCDALQEQAVEAIVQEGIEEVVPQALLPLVSWLHPEELGPGGLVHEFWLAAQPLGPPPQQQAGQGQGEPRPLGHRQPPGGGVPGGGLPGMGGGRQGVGEQPEGGGVGGEWVLLQRQLERLRAAHPSVPVAALVMLQPGGDG